MEAEERREERGADGSCVAVVVGVKRSGDASSLSMTVSASAKKDGVGGSSVSWEGALKRDAEDALAEW